MSAPSHLLEGLAAPVFLQDGCPPLPHLTPAFKIICAIVYCSRIVLSNYEPLAANSFFNLSQSRVSLLWVLPCLPSLPPNLGVLTVASGTRDTHQPHPQSRSASHVPLPAPKTLGAVFALLKKSKRDCLCSVGAGLLEIPTLY